MYCKNVESCNCYKLCIIIVMPDLYERNGIYVSDLYLAVLALSHWMMDSQAQQYQLQRVWFLGVQRKHLHVCLVFVHTIYKPLPHFLHSSSAE